MTRRIKCNFSLLPETYDKIKRMAKANGVAFGSQSHLIDVVVSDRWEKERESVVAFETKEGIPSDVEEHRKKSSLQRKDIGKKM